tara:strand:- start:373 stop:621 length:249 start_codon:yes stop_codon:yes gene_type:complete
MKEIIYFSAPWCNPCKTLSPIMESLTGQISYRKINVDNDTELSAQYGVRNVPTLVYVKDGVAFDRLVGIQTQKQILNVWDNG